ncbi:MULTISPECIES: ABC transporter permease [Blautia]|uniref:ABC transporter permease n=1 Tax=Blautia TaxID=572511 RepID=UPI000BA3B812|nr:MULTISPECIES: ABC transporter permease [Blautia]
MMLNNNNRKFIKTLSNNCLKANRNRNVIAVLAIILTAVLFTALATVAQGTQVSMKEQMLRQAGTRFMVSIKNLSQEEAESLVQDSAFSTAGMERYVANAVNKELNSIMVSIGWLDRTNVENSFMDLEKGHYPEKDNEIACDSVVLELLGLPNETGTSFTLEYETMEGIKEAEMTVCGIWKGMKHEQRSVMMVTEGFVEKTVKDLSPEYAELEKNAYAVRGTFPSEKDIKENLDKLVEKMGYDPEAQRGEEGFIIHNTNPVYETKSMDSGQTMITMALGVILILLAGYLIIYNIFKISIEKDIRLYGQLKTIGTSPKQIRYMVNRQGMMLSLVGVPVGLILGWLLGNALLPLVMASTSYSDTIFIKPNLWVWLFAAAFTLLTVRISCSRPGKIAGKISPVEALKYHGAKSGKKKQKKGMDSKNRILQMAGANLGRNKGKTVLVILSICLSVILLNSVLNFTESMDKEAYVQHETAADFDVRSGNFLKSVTEDYLKVVPQKEAQELKALEGIKDFTQVYVRMLPEQQLTEGREDCGKLVKINGETTPDDIMEFDRNRMLYGFDENAFKRAKLIEGTIDYEKLCTGDYVVANGSLSDRGEYGYEIQELHAGDVIEVEIEGEMKEYTVMAVIGTLNSLNMSYSAGGYEAITFSESVFREMFPENQDPIHCLFDVEDGYFDSINSYMEDFTQDSGLALQSRLTAEEEFAEMQGTYNAVGMIVALILGIIGVLNLINVIFTGAIARQREFASMRSIGMTRKQLKKLFVYEGIIYAVLAGMAGVAISAVVSLTLVKSFASGFWFAKYHFIILPAIVTALICLLLSVIISAVVDKVWNKGSVVEQLREVE